MSGLLDTNLLIYAVNQDSAQHRRARSFLENRLSASDPLYLSWSNLYEFLRVTTHPKVFARPLSWNQAFQMLEVFLDSPQVEILREGEEHGRILQEILKGLRNPRGNFMHDCHLAALMREHGVKTVYTHDMDFRLFGFLEVVDPLA